MGGRQSSQSNNPRQQSNVTDPSTSRYSVGSLENEPSGGGSRAVLFSGPSGSIDLGGSPSGAGVVRRRRRRDRNDMFIETHSLPAHLFPTALLSANIKCPVCNKRIASNEVESHLLICLAKPKVSYNEDVLTTDSGECIICFEDMCQGDRIARLQCLCIYHKHCLDEWFQRNRCCPEHPDQAPQEYMETLPRNPSRSNRVPLDTSLSLNDSNESSNEALLDSPPPPLVTNSLPTTLTLSREHLSPVSERLLEVDAHTNSPSTSTIPRTPDFENDTPNDGANDVESMTSQSDDVNDVSLSSLQDDAASRSTNSPFTVMLETDDDTALTTTVVVDDDNTLLPSMPVVASDRSPVVHVDEGSTHGTTSLFDEEELAQLTSRKMNLFRNDNTESNEVDDT